jgi:hypothetical protein
MREVRRRRADPHRKLLPHAEALERIGRLDEAQDREGGHR